MSEGLSGSNYNFEEIVSGWGKEDAIPVPPQCEFCPRVMAIRDDLDALGKSAECLATAAMGDKVIISTDGKAIDGDEVAECLRKMAIEKFNERDKEAKIAKKEIERSTNGCKGPLALEGSDVCVVICNSPEMSKSDPGKPQIGEPVIIKREKKNED